VGLVYIALASPYGITVREFHFPGRRFAVRAGVVNATFKMLREFLEQYHGAPN